MDGRRGRSGMDFGDFGAISPLYVLYFEYNLISSPLLTTSENSKRTAGGPKAARTIRGAL